MSPEAYSASEVMRHRDFDRMTSAELREAERLVDLLTPRLELRRTRRHELHPHGRRIAPRQMLRRNLATGGDFTTWLWRRPVYRPRRLVVLCDISGSMERHSRLLLRFIQALTRTSEVKAESFVFGDAAHARHPAAQGPRSRPCAEPGRRERERLGRRHPHRRELPRVQPEVGRRTLRTSGVVIVVSDGWDRGDPALVAARPRGSDATATGSCGSIRSPRRPATSRSPPG